MLNRKNIIWAIALIAVLIATGAMLSTAVARSDNPKASDRLAIGTEEVKQLLLLMDTDKNGKISKQEYMTFMAEEFDRLDTDKSGELDTTELRQSKLRASNFAYAGK